MDNFIPSENPSGVEQLKRCAVIATQNVARLRQQQENEPDEFTNEAWVGIYSGRPVSSDRARNSRLVDTDSTIEAIGTTAAGAKIQKAWLAVKATGTSCVLVELVLQ